MLLQLLLVFLATVKFLQLIFFFRNSYIVLGTERLWLVHVTTNRDEKIFSVLILLQFKRMTQNYVLHQQKPAHYYSFRTLLPTNTCENTQTGSLFPLLQVGIKDAEIHISLHKF